MNFFKTKKIYIIILLVFFVFTGVVVLVLNKKSVVQNEAGKVEKGIQKPEFLSYINKEFGYDLTYPSNWELNELADGSLKIYPKDLYNPNYEYENVLLIEPKLSTSSVFEQGEKSGCRFFINTFLAGLPAKMCEETGLNLKTSYYRITEVSQTSWGKFNMVSFSLNSDGEFARPEFEKIISQLHITTKSYSENDKKTWKKYENKDYKFQLIYPEKYGQYAMSLKTESVNNAQIDPILSINFIATPTLLPFQEMVVPEYMMDLQVLKGQKINNWLKNQTSTKDYIVSPFKTEQINGVSVVTYTTTDTTAKEQSTDLWAVWQADENFYVYACDLNKYGSFCKEILNSIKTTNSTSTWKTYRNAEYGFEFQYPKDWKVEINQGGIAISEIKNSERPEINIRWSTKSIDLIKQDLINNLDEYIKPKIKFETTTFTGISVEVVEHETAIGSMIRNYLFTQGKFNFWIQYGYEFSPDKEIIETFKFTK